MLYNSIVLNTVVHLFKKMLDQFYIFFAMSAKHLLPITIIINFFNSGISKISPLLSDMLLIQYIKCRARIVSGYCGSGFISLMYFNNHYKFYWLLTDYNPC